MRFTFGTASSTEKVIATSSELTVTNKYKTKPYIHLAFCQFLHFSLVPNGPKTPEAKEEDKLLESYLMNMKIDQGQLRLPPNSELPDGFNLFYQRRSLRRTYRYEMDGEQFALTVYKDQAKGANTDLTDLCSFEETATKVSN